MATPKLPPELIPLIVNHLATDDYPSTIRALRSCSLAAHIFVPLCQPHLFHTISTYTSHPATIDTSPYHPRLAIPTLDDYGEREYEYQYKGWTDLLRHNPTLGTYVRNLKICLFNRNHQPDDARSMDRHLPWVLDTLAGVHSLTVTALSWNVGKDLNTALLSLFARPTLHTLRVERSLSVSPWHLRSLTHVRHLAFERVARESLPVFVRELLGNSDVPFSRLPVESLAITSCGNMVVNIIKNLVPKFDFSNLKQLTLGFGHPAEMFVSRVITSTSELVESIAEPVEELTVVVYAERNVYTPIDFGGFVSLRRLIFDVQFERDTPGADPLQTIAPLLQSITDVSPLEVVRIVAPVCDREGTVFSWLDRTDWKALSGVFVEYKRACEAFRVLQLEFVYGGGEKEVVEYMHKLEKRLVCEDMVELGEGGMVSVRCRVVA